MGRTRQIKYEFFLNEGLASLDPMARLLFIGLWTICDKEGRLEYRPARIKAQLFPYNEALIEGLLASLSGYLTVYEAEGSRFIQIKKFLDHQRPHPGEKISVIPKFGDGCREIKLDFIGSNEETPKSNSKSKPNSNLAPLAQEVKVEIQKPLTGIQKVMRAFKEAKGIDADDADWDTLHFKRFARPAADLLKIFKNDADAAILYVLKKGGDLDDKQMSSWGLEAVSRAAATDAQVITFNGEKNGRENKPVVANLDDGPRSTRRLASSGSLVGDALRGLEHAAVHPEGPSDLGGPDDDWSGD